MHPGIVAQTFRSESDIMVSFDVAGLFTRVPVDEALQVISELLSQDKTLMNRNMIVDEFQRLHYRSNSSWMLMSK